MAPSDVNASENIYALRQLKVHLGGLYTKCAKRRRYEKYKTMQDLPTEGKVLVSLFEIFKVSVL